MKIKITLPCDGRIWHTFEIDSDDIAQYKLNQLRDKNAEYRSEIAHSLIEDSFSHLIPDGFELVSYEDIYFDELEVIIGDDDNNHDDNDHGLQYALMP